MNATESKNTVSSAHSKAYCVAPWSDGILFEDGSFQICYRNPRKFGNWQKDNLRSCWQNKELQNFRKTMATGLDPDSHCKTCRKSNYAISARTHLFQTFILLRRQLHTFELSLKHVFDALEILFAKRETEPGDLISLKNLSAQLPTKRGFSKLHQLVGVLEDFYKGSTKPKYVAPIRQVRYATRCNAKCVMCPARYTGEIFHGDFMDTSFYDASLSEPKHLLQFYACTTELFVIKNWRELCLQAKAQSGVRPRIITNAKLLTPANIDFLLENDLLEDLHISINGATKESIENIQEGIDYAVLTKNISYLIEKLPQLKSPLHLKFSFVILKRNYTEIADFIDFICQFEPTHPKVLVNALYILLHPLDIEGYAEFFAKEDPLQIPTRPLQTQLENAQTKCNQSNIEAFLCSCSDFTPLATFLQHANLANWPNSRQSLQATIAQTKSAAVSSRDNTSVLSHDRKPNDHCEHQKNTRLAQT